MKAVSVVVSHMSYLAVGMIALSLVVAFVYVWGDKLEENFLQKELDLISSSVRSEVMNLKTLSDTSNLVENRVLAEIGTSFPDKISNDRYNVEFSSNRILVSSKTSKNKKIESSVLVPFNMENSSAVSPFTIRLEREIVRSQGLFIDKIYLVD